MAITFRFEVKKTPSSNGTYPVYIRITKDRKLKRVKTSVELNKLSEWNPKAQPGMNVRTTNKNAKVLNAALERELDKVKEIYRSDYDMTIDTIAIKARGGEKSGSFVKYAQSVATDLKERGATNANHYRGLCNKLEDFMTHTGRSDIAFSDLTPTLLGEFTSYLYSRQNMQFKKTEHRLSPNTIKCVMVKLRAVVNRAVKENLIAMDKSPFKNYTMPKEVAINRSALDEDELQRLLDLELPKDKRLWDARNCYLFSFYCAGIRIGDLFRLRWSNITEGGTRIQYVMNKTQKQRNFPLQPQAIGILEMYRKPTNKLTDFIFPFLDNDAKYAQYDDMGTMPVEVSKQLYEHISSKTQIVNKNLKKLADMAGIQKHLTNHTSRHSFASIAKGKDISSKMLQEAMGHSSLSITERYMHDFGSIEMDKALKKVYNPQEEKPKSTLEKLKEELNGLSDEDRLKLLELLRV